MKKISALAVTIPSLAQGLFTLLIAVVMGIYYSWKMGLVASLFIPVLLVGIILQQKIITGEDSIEKAAFEKSAQVWPFITYLSGFLVKTLVGDQGNPVTFYKDTLGYKDPVSCVIKTEDNFIE